MVDPNVRLLSARRSSTCPQCDRRISPGALIVQTARNEAFVCHRCARPFLERLLAEADRELPNVVSDADLADEFWRLCKASRQPAREIPEGSSTDDVDDGSLLQVGQRYETIDIATPAGDEVTLRNVFVLDRLSEPGRDNVVLSSGPVACPEDWIVRAVPAQDDAAGE